MAIFLGAQKVGNALLASVFIHCLVFCALYVHVWLHYNEVSLNACNAIVDAKVMQLSDALCDRMSREVIALLTH